VNSDHDYQGKDFASVLADSRFPPSSYVLVAIDQELTGIRVHFDDGFQRAPAIFGWRAAWRAVAFASWLAAY